MDELGRRQFLGRSALTLGALAGLSACDKAPAARTAAATPSPSLAGWDAVRAEFALDPELHHLSAFYFSSHPRVVRDAIDRHRTGLDADPRGYMEAHEAGLEGRVADAAADYLNTSPELIAFTDSTTMGLGLLYGGLELEAGDEVITSVHDFYATDVALRQRERTDGIVVKRVRLYDDPRRATQTSVVRAIQEALTPRTKVVALTWVHSSTGFKLPVASIAGMLKGRALLCVDGVHGFGVEVESPDLLGCDFLVTGTHKWLFGPRGTGLMWGSPRGWERLRWTIPTFEGSAYQSWVDPENDYPTPPGALNTPGGFHSFENRWALAEAFEWRTGLGADEVQARTRSLVASLKDGLSSVDGVEVVTPSDPELSSGLVCCSTDMVSPWDVVERLRKDHGVVATVTPYRDSFLRFGPSIANSEKDVEAAVEGLAAVMASASA